MNVTAHVCMYVFVIKMAATSNDKSPGGGIMQQASLDNIMIRWIRQQELFVGVLVYIYL